MNTTEPARQSMLPSAPAREALGIMINVLGPTLAKGVIIRRPNMVGLVERLDLDRRSVRHMQQLRRRHPEGPPLIGPIRGRRWALLLAPEHVRRVLDGTPEPFATASSEKRAALSHFQPKGVLISHGAERADRRRFNEDALEADRPAHRLAEKFLATVAEEAERLLAEVRPRGELAWDEFASTWFRIVRRVVFGDAARNDHEVTDLIARLRSYANWAFLRRKRPSVRDRFLQRVSDHLARAEPGSLASVMATVSTTGHTAPSHQVPQWLFAFDPAGMTTFRALALLATHPAQMDQARREIRDRDRSDLPYVRACVLESLRLWPTAPLVLRQSTEETVWEGGRMPAQTGIIIFAPFFHRDDERLPFADRFTPDVWLEGQPAEDWPLIPFSAGPARCPGRQLVLLLTSAMLAGLVTSRQVSLKPPARLDPRQPLPGTLNNYALRFQIGT